MSEEKTVPTIENFPTSDVVKDLQRRGYYVARTPLERRGKTHKTDLKRWSGNKFKFGVVSDTHLGSRYQQLRHLSAFYTICARRRIDVVFHCGDLVDGEKIYRGQEYEIFVHGADAQRNYAVDHYPSRKRITTKVISGNHDQSFHKHAGYNIVESICRRRRDMEYLGDDVAYVQVGNVRIGVFHGTGGTAYATSYKSQKLVEKIPGGEKPNLLFLGHYHHPNIIPGYRNVETVQMSCFQAQTPYMAAKGLYPFVAGLIVTVQEDKDGLAKVIYEWIPFYQAVKNDF